MFRGSMVAIVTPFKDGRIDENALSELIEFQIANGTDAIVPCGTTGESAVLTYEEHNRVVEIVVSTVNKRVLVIAGTGSNNTEEAVSLTKYARKSGADAALLITPYYNKPTQEGLYQHFKRVAEAVDIPLILYNVPGRTSINLLPPTVARLSEIRNIQGIKEATGSLQHVSEIRRLCGDEIDIISGDDFTTLPILSVGGKGVISVTANIIPKDIADMIDAFDKGDLKGANDLHYKTFPLHTAMFIETNPIPVKAALSLMGRIAYEYRLPMCPMAEGNLERLKTAMKEYGLI